MYLVKLRKYMRMIQGREKAFPAPFHHLIAVILLTSPDSGTWGSVRSDRVAIGVDSDSGVALGGVSWDRGEERASWLSRSGSLDLKLGALSIELRGLGLMKSEELVTDEVISRSKGSRNGALPVEVLEDLSGTPVAAGQRWGGHALLIDFEPLLAGAVARLEVASALVQPDHDGALLVSPLLPDGADLSSGFDGSGQIGRSAAVAHDLPVGNGHGGVVVGPLTLDGLWARSGSEALVSSIVVNASKQSISRDRLTQGTSCHR
jgi:hypothetical protein